MMMARTACSAYLWLARSIPKDFRLISSFLIALNFLGIFRGRYEIMPHAPHKQSCQDQYRPPTWWVLSPLQQVVRCQVSHSRASSRGARASPVVIISFQCIVRREKKTITTKLSNIRSHHIAGNLVPQLSHAALTLLKLVTIHLFIITNLIKIYFSIWTFAFLLPWVFSFSDKCLFYKIIIMTQMLMVVMMARIVIMMRKCIFLIEKLTLFSRESSSRLASLAPTLCLRPPCRTFKKIFAILAKTVKIGQMMLIEDNRIVHGQGPCWASP